MTISGSIFLLSIFLLHSTSPHVRCMVGIDLDLKEVFCVEKTYSALIDRLRLSAVWHVSHAIALERQPDLNDDEKQTVVKDKAIAEWIEMVIKRELD